MNNNYRLFSLCLFLFIYSQYSFGQINSFTDKYILDFDLRNKNVSSLKADIRNNNISDWKPDYSNFLTIQQDSSQTIHGKNPLFLGQIKLNKLALRLHGQIQQTIFLPVTNADSAIVSLNCKSKNLLNARMIIYGIDAREHVLYSDTLFVNGTNEWNKFSRAVSFHDVAYLNLTIQAGGIKTISDQRLYLDKIEIKINGKDLNDYPLPIVPNIPDLNKSDIISLSLSDHNSFNKIAELKTKKIVAIGETIHGSESITQTAVNMIKHQVEFNNCKLILLELPLELTLPWNRFVQGDNQFNIDTLSQKMKLYLYSPPVMIDLLTWLKQYNESAKDKVWILGMDINSSSYDLSLNLFNYFNSLDDNKHSILLDSLCLKVYHRDTLPQALQYLEKNKGLEDLLGKNEYEIVCHYLKGYIDNGKIKVNLFPIRDNQMYSNATFLLNQLCPNNEKATIYAHLGHTNLLANDLSLPFDKSFGYFMKNDFGDQYYTMAVLTGEGTITTGVNDSLFVKRTLQIPPENSLEYLFLRTNEEFCFTPISIIPNQLTYIHHIGMQLMENQFSLINPGNRMDALLFIRKSKAFDPLPGTPTCSKDTEMLQFKEIEVMCKKYLKQQKSVKQ